MPALNTSMWRFLVLSLALHAAGLLLFYPLRPALVPRQEPIAVSLLTGPEKVAPAPQRAPRVPATRLSRARSKIAKADAPISARKNSPAQGNLTRNESTPARPTPVPPPPPRETIPEQSVIAERQLPTLKELLPAATWSSSSERKDAPVSLNTRDPVFVTYFTKVKQLIESHWEYPELALRYGLQGRLSLEFTIGGNGQLDQLRLIRSSGSQLLDEEAMRAIKAAAPFPPIPSWIKPNPLPISASMEYHDNRLNYRFTR
jgi:protein TonB